MAKSDDSAKMPSHVGRGLSLFDRFAVLVLIWVPTFWLWPSIDGRALVINTFRRSGSSIARVRSENADLRIDAARGRYGFRMILTAPSCLFWKMS